MSNSNRCDCVDIDQLKISLVHMQESLLKYAQRLDNELEQSSELTRKKKTLSVRTSIIALLTIFFTCMMVLVSECYSVVKVITTCKDVDLLAM